MTHGVDRGDVVWADVAVVDGGVGFRDPVRILPVRVRSDLSQQPHLHRTTLIVPPEGQQKVETGLEPGLKLVLGPGLAAGLRTSLPDVGLQDSGGVGALDALVQTSFSSHQSMPEGDGALLDASSTGNIGLNKDQRVRDKSQSR